LRTYHCPHSSLYKLHSSTAIFLFGFLTLEDGTNRLSENVGKKLTTIRWSEAQESADLIYFVVGAWNHTPNTTDIATVLFCDQYQHLRWNKSTSCQFPPSSRFLLTSYTTTSLFFSQPGNLA
jgi:hypothetical protein